MAPGHPGVVERQRLLTQHVLDDEHALGEPDVGQLRCGDDVADGAHALQPTCDSSSSTSTNPRSLTSTPAWSRPSRSTKGRRPTDMTIRSVSTCSPPSSWSTVPSAPRRVTLHLDVGADGDLPLLERPLHRPGDVLITTREDLRHGLEDGHLAAEIGQHRGELAADRAAPDHHGAARDVIDRQQLVGGDHDPSVDVEPGQGPGHRAGCQDHVPPLELHLARTAAADQHRPIGGQAAGSVVHGDLATGQQTAEALGQLIDDGLLALLGGGHVEPGDLGRDAELTGLADGAVHGRRLEQFLGRDAADVQAGTADLLSLDHGDVQPRRGAVESRRVAGWATADDDHVELLGHGGHLLSEGRAYRPSDRSSAGRDGQSSSNRAPKQTVGAKPHSRGVPQAFSRRTGRSSSSLNDQGAAPARSACRRVPSGVRKEDLHGAGDHDGQAAQEGCDDQTPSAHGAQDTSSGLSPSSTRSGPVGVDDGFGALVPCDHPAEDHR